MHILLILLDLACLLLAFAIAGALYPYSGNQWLIMVTAVAPVYLGAGLNGRAFSGDITVNVRQGVLRACQALLVTFVALVFVAFYFKTSTRFSRAALAIGFGLSLTFLAIARSFFLTRTRTILGGSPYHVVLISDRPQQFPKSDVSRVIAPSFFGPIEDTPLIYERLAVALRNADRVIIDCSREECAIWSHVLQGANVFAEVILPELTDLRPLGLGAIGSTPTIVVARGPLGIFDRGLKRCLDLAFTVAALIALAPALVLVAIAIKLESRGPVFFLQDRVGRGNALFRIIKFRSMSTDRTDHIGTASTRRDDDRITRVGRFIRASSIDELPQLFNVLKGDMSIVGPRPHALGSTAEGHLFWEIDPCYRYRHAIKPGLTGLAQVRGFRGATHIRSDLTDRLSADLEYLNGWSIWRDVKIIMMTLNVVFHTNAY